MSQIPLAGRAPLPLVLALLAVAGCGREPAEDAPSSSLRSTPPAIAAEPVADTADDGTAALADAIARYFRENGSAPTDAYDTATLDLNADGADDALVFVSDAAWCGSGGCTLLVFEGTGGGTGPAFRFVSETSLVNGPVMVSEKRTNGWRELLIPDPSAERTLALQFSGSGYPADPEGPTADEPAGETVFEGEVGLF